MDIVGLQRLKWVCNRYSGSINNKMMFHPDKCKVVTIKHKPSPLAMLPFVAYHSITTTSQKIYFHMQIVKGT